MQEINLSVASISLLLQQLCSGPILEEMLFLLVAQNQTENIIFYYNKLQHYQPRSFAPNSIVCLSLNLRNLVSKTGADFWQTRIDFQVNRTCAVASN